MKKKSPLSSLEEVISGTVKTASELAQEVCQEIEGEIYRLAAKLDIATRADDRAKIEKAINAKIKKLEEAISELEAKALVKATGAANKDAGLEVKHSNAYTREILKRVQDANGQNLAAVFTNKMSSSIIDRLRAATVAVIQEASLTGMSLREQKNALREKWEKACSGLGKAEFVDKMGKDWRARDYFTMNIRTNAMRVYNDVLAGDIVTDGGDLAQISRHGDPHCASCFPWEGRIISITGKTKGFPTYEQARNAGCFHPNCTHTLETVNEVVDGDEIALQKAFNQSHTNLAGDGDKMANVFRLDVVRKMTLEGMEKADAEIAVKRERLTAALRVGTIRADAAKVVAALTDKEVETLTNGVKVPVFTLAKKGEESGWNQGSKGGHIILPKVNDLTAALSKVVKDAEAKKAPAGAKNDDAFFRSIGVKKTDAGFSLSDINPEYELSRRATTKDMITNNFTQDALDAQAELKRRGLYIGAYTQNCQRCVPTYEANKRGYPVKALPRLKGNDAVANNWRYIWKNQNWILMPNTKRNPSRAQIENQMSVWGDGARAEVYVVWAGGRSAHVFIAEQRGKKTVFIDPQTGKIDYSSWESDMGRHCEILRIDNNPFTDLAKQCFTSRKVQ